MNVQKSLQNAGHITVSGKSLGRTDGGCDGWRVVHHCMHLAHAMRALTCVQMTMMRRMRSCVRGAVAAGARYVSWRITTPSGRQRLLPCLPFWHLLHGTAKPPSLPASASLVVVLQRDNSAFLNRGGPRVSASVGSACATARTWTTRPLTSCTLARLPLSAMEHGELPAVCDGVGPCRHAVAVSKKQRSGSSTGRWSNGSGARPSTK